MLLRPLSIASGAARNKILPSLRGCLTFGLSHAHARSQTPFVGFSPHPPSRVFSSGTIEKKFEDAVRQLKEAPGGGNAENSTKLQLYALYKQATEGPCTTPQPGFTEFKKRAMWGAWSELKDMPKSTAMAEYCEMVLQVTGGKAPSVSSQKSSPKLPEPQEAFNPELVSFEVAETGVATIFLESLTCPPEWFGALRAAVKMAEQDERTRVILVRCGKTNKHFTYGLDLHKAGASLMSLPQKGPRRELHELILDWQAAFTALEDSPKPVIAAVSGWCIGAGVELIAAADVRLCSADAKFALKEAALGIVADLGGLQRLPPIIGEGHTRYLALTAADIGAEKAFAFGLVSDVVADHDTLLREAEKMAEAMASMEPLCMQGIKHVMNYGRGKTVPDGLQYVAAWNASFLDMQAVGARVESLQKKGKK